MITVRMKRQTKKQIAIQSLSQDCLKTLLTIIFSIKNTSEEAHLMLLQFVLKIYVTTIRI